MKKKIKIGTKRCGGFIFKGYAKNGDEIWVRPLPKTTYNDKSIFDFRKEIAKQVDRAMNAGFDLAKPQGRFLFSPNHGK